MRSVSVLQAYNAADHPLLALPPGELSPQVTERALLPFWMCGVSLQGVYPLRPRCARPPLPRGEASYTARFIPLTLPPGNAGPYFRRASPLALPLGELSPQVTERALLLRSIPLIRIHGSFIPSARSAASPIPDRCCTGWESSPESPERIDPTISGAASDRSVHHQSACG